jgi:hypothetical protein
LFHSPKQTLAHVRSTYSSRMDLIHPIKHYPNEHPTILFLPHVAVAVCHHRAKSLVIHHCLHLLLSGSHGAPLISTATQTCQGMTLCLHYLLYKSVDPTVTSVASLDRHRAKYSSSPLFSMN